MEFERDYGSTSITTLSANTVNTVIHDPSLRHILHPLPPARRTPTQRMAPCSTCTRSRGLIPLVTLVEQSRTIPADSSHSVASTVFLAAPRHSKNANERRLRGAEPCGRGAGVLDRPGLAGDSVRHSAHLFLGNGVLRWIGMAGSVPASTCRMELFGAVPSGGNQKRDRARPRIM